MGCNKKRLSKTDNLNKKFLGRVGMPAAGLAASDDPMLSDR